MEEEQIETVKNWSKPTSIRDIQVFIDFANFYRRFIWGFSKIAAPLTSMLKTTATSEKMMHIGVGNPNRLTKNEQSGNSSSGTIEKLQFLTLRTKEAFKRLRQAFNKAPIFWHFDLESHIQIETDVSGYAIDGVLSQQSNNLITPDFSQWHLVAYFSMKMILVKTQYKTHDAELLAIVEAFKTWRY